MRLEWDRCSDRTTSEASMNEVELRVELDKGAVPPYTWEVRGCSATRTLAFDAAERAAVAALRAVKVQSAELEELLKALQNDQATLLVRGQPMPSLLRAVAQLALEATLKEDRTEPGTSKVRVGVKRKNGMTRRSADA